MKLTTLLTFATLFFAASSQGAVVDTFSRVTINPKGSHNYTANATVHLVTAAGFNDPIEKIIARETIASALKLLSSKELTSEFSIAIAKDKILSLLKEAEFIGGNKVESVYVTELYLTHTGEKRIHLSMPVPKR